MISKIENRNRKINEESGEKADFERKRHQKTDG